MNAIRKLLLQLVHPDYTLLVRAVQFEIRGVTTEITQWGI